jgi:hypothetical protein
MGRDTIAGLVVLVVSLALFGLTFRIQSNPLVPVSPAFYPRLVLGTPRPRTAHGWIVLALVALIATAATYYVFEAYLQVLLPRGRWTDF